MKTLKINNKKQTKSILFILILLVGIGTSGIHLPAEPQPQKDVIITTSNKDAMPMIPVALPDFYSTEKSPEETEVSQELHKALWNDLSYSRVFKMIPKEHYSYISKHTPSRIVYKDWASIQANILVSGQVEVSAQQRIIFSMKVYDINSEKFIFGRNFGGKTEFVRLIAHRAADAIMQHFGEKLIFTSKLVFVSDRDGNKEIYFMDYDGRRQKRITYNDYIDMLPSWSLDREKVLYTSYRNGNPDLYMFHLYTGHTELISTGQANYSADWSKEGDKIVYTSTRSGNAEIYSKDMKTRKEKRLTFNRVIDTSPCWSPNAREIAFISNRSGTAQVYIMDAEGSNIRRITSEGTRHDSPEWSPDGTQLAYTLMINGGIDIYVYHLKENTIRKLTENAWRNENPTWSPEGRHIIFASNRGGTYQLYTMDFDGSNLRQLTSKGENKMPYWQK
ncbi:MAG: Tol-Pal system beta propeller repeat protein TolB [bacterium]|nr:Tol-Pal system beta propeller repeat protein TolB [bacterium]